MDEPVPGSAVRPGAGGAPHGRWARAAAYLLVLVLALQNALWSIFLLPLRVGGVLVPVSLLLAGPGTAALGVAGARVLGRRAGAVAPGLLWVVLALLAGSRRSEGDLLITGGGGSGLATLGLVFLLVGTMGAAAGYGVARTARAGAAAAQPSAALPEGAAPQRATSTSPEAPPRR